MSTNNIDRQVVDHLKRLAERDETLETAKEIATSLVLPVATVRGSLRRLNASGEVREVGEAADRSATWALTSDPRFPPIKPEPENTKPALPRASAMSLAYAQRRIRTNANDLRRLADVFDRTADDLAKVPTPGRARAAEVAARIIHEHAVWLMNAQLDSAVTYAAEADLYRETGD